MRIVKRARIMSALFTAIAPGHMNACNRLAVSFRAMPHAATSAAAA
jgi:hypothetical protein